MKVRAGTEFPNLTKVCAAWKVDGNGRIPFDLESKTPHHLFPHVATSQAVRPFMR